MAFGKIELGKMTFGTNEFSKMTGIKATIGQITNGLGYLLIVKVNRI